MKNIKLLGENVLVRVEDPDEQLKGIWLPRTAERLDSDYCRATVMAVGPGQRSVSGIFHPTEVVPGDRVYFAWTAGKIAVTRWPDKNHIVIPESKIQAIIEP